MELTLVLGRSAASYVRLTAAVAFHDLAGCAWRGSSLSVWYFDDVSTLLHGICGHEKLGEDMSSEA
jgi:hypothetical protein